jgi:(p)ppGpp synthase/HD superfamily hydrolase
VERPVVAAIAYARRQHSGQHREADGAPFILHPLEVGALLQRAGAPAYVVAAGVLHDAVEKADADVDELRAQFGARVTAIVLAVTDDARIVDYRERKAALRRQVSGAGHDALTVFAADKISKVRELRLDSPVLVEQARPAGTPRQLRLDNYRACLELLERELPTSQLVGWLAIELDTLPASIVDERLSADAA